MGHLCHETQLNKEVKEESEILMAHIWLFQSKEVKLVSLFISLELQTILSEFPLVFDTIVELSPPKRVDHGISLLPNAEPVNLRLYRYFYF
jgi:hypothetical protein